MLPLDQPALVVLPDPISTNNLFGNVPGRGRVMTKAYKEWKKGAARLLLAQRPLPQFALPVEITFYVGEKRIGQMDSDNTLKAYLDALKVAGVIHDDSRKWVRRATAVWVPGLAGCVVRIKVADMDISAASILSVVPERLRGILI
jgi:Holliday junction resolvase RusA-like endonuclease